MTTQEAIVRQTTNGVAVGGISMPVWFDRLADVSSVAAHLVPILSAVWLGVQIAGFAWRHWRRLRA